MILNMYCIRDRATDSFGNPMFLMSHGQAIRSFTDEINRSASDNTIYAHPDDYDLYHLGEYDTAQGEFKPIKPAMILVGKSAAIR